MSAAAGAKFLRGGAFKPRSSPYSFQGMGLDGLKLLREVADETGLLVITEVMEISQIESMIPYIDCFQVGARNMQNFNLLRELGHTRTPVLMKRGIVGDDRRGAAVGGVHPVRRQLRPDAVRARHPHVRDVYAQHDGHLGDSGAEEADAPAGDGAIRRMAWAFATWCRRWRWRRLRRARMGC